MPLTQGEIRDLPDRALLEKIAEESSEVIKASMKMALHGARPFWAGVQYDNVSDVIEEFEQLYSLIIEFKDRFR